MPISDYLAAELQPHNLSKEEITDPIVVFCKLFDTMHLPQVREALWHWLKLTITGKFKSESSDEKVNVIMTYELIVKVIEAAHLIYQRSKSII